MSKQKLIMVKGLPASGKTTWALEQVEKGNGQVKRVNKDDLRDMIDGGKHSKEREDSIVNLQEVIVKRYLDIGYSVIVDNTHLAKKWEKYFKDMADMCDIDFEVKDFTHVPLKECIRRDLLRGEKVGEKAIRRMYNQHLRQPPVYNVYDITLGDCVICDIDGTLAHMRGRSPYDIDRVDEDAVDWNVRELITSFSEDYIDDVILFSGRKESAREKTEKWLVENGIEYKALYMRADDDNRADTVVKREMYEKHIKGKYNVICAIDDRDQVVDMWRENGVKCLQVERGDF